MSPHTPTDTVDDASTSSSEYPAELSVYPPRCFPVPVNDVLKLEAKAQPDYSICTIVTRPDEYQRLLRSFANLGFVDGCEYMFVGNAGGNKVDGFEAFNLFIRNARSRYIIVVHQDVELIDHGREQLDAKLAELAAVDPYWGICGNAGGISPGSLALRISDPYGNDRRSATLPARVASLDENFLVLRRDANLATSRDIHGFHFYAADLCMLAGLRGFSSYVIDFHLRHYSSGTKDAEFFRLRRAFADKYSLAFRGRFLTTPCTTVYISGLSVFRRILNWLVAARLTTRLGARYPKAAAWLTSGDRW